MIGMSFLYYVRDIFFRQSLLSILKASDMETTGMRLPLRHCLFTWMAWLLYTYRVTQYVRTHIHVVIELALTKNAKPSTYYWFLHFKRKVPTKNAKNDPTYAVRIKFFSMAKLHPFLMEGPTFTMTFVLMARGTKCAILLSLVRHRIKMGRRQAA